MDFIIFIDFLDSKNLCFFFVGSGRQKIEGVGPRVARRCETRPRVFTGGGGSCRLGPQGGHARDQKVERGQWPEGKRTRGKEGKWKSREKEKLETERRKEGNGEGSNTPVGQRPGEFPDPQNEYLR